MPGQWLSSIAQRIEVIVCTSHHSYTGETQSEREFRLIHPLPNPAHHSREPTHIAVCHKEQLLAAVLFQAGQPHLAAVPLHVQPVRIERLAQTAIVGNVLAQRVLAVNLRWNGMRRLSVCRTR